MNVDEALRVLWAQLEAYTKTALEWPPISEADVWADHAYFEIARLQNEVEKVRASAVGRGLAIAIQILDPTAYGDSTMVVNEAVRRYMEQKE